MQISSSLKKFVALILVIYLCAGLEGGALRKLDGCEVRGAAGGETCPQLPRFAKMTAGVSIRQPSCSAGAVYC
ncbi:hypothetical protein NTCA1_52960 [Novosphingobium sp. TCA1]|nr:hypothetical protein NTCA1_52960 [Novosphingobium sp. TCA1]